MEVIIQPVCAALTVLWSTSAGRVGGFATSATPTCAACVALGGAVNGPVCAIALMPNPRPSANIAINRCMNARIETPFRKLLRTRCTSHASRRPLFQGESAYESLQRGAGNSQCTIEVQPLQLPHSKARSGVPSEGPEETSFLPITKFKAPNEVHPFYKRWRSQRFFLAHFLCAAPEPRGKQSRN
ncbi:MAG: hypothetical protein ACYCXC_01035 [Acidovorax defluvii]